MNEEADFIRRFVDDVENLYKRVLEAQKNISGEDRKAFGKRIDFFRKNFEEITAFIDEVESPYSRAMIYRSLIPLMRASIQLGGAFHVTDEVGKFHRKTTGARTARNGKAAIVEEKRAIVAKYDALARKDALPLINAELKKRHLRPMAASTLYKYRPRLTV